MGRILLAVVLGCSSMVAQKMILGDDRDRQVAVFAVADLAPDGTEGGAAPMPAVAARFAGPERAGLDDIASILGSRAQRPGDHLRVIGPGHLVVLGAPDWIGSVESMLVHMREAGQKEIQVNARFCRVSDALLHRVIRLGHLPGFARVAEESDTSSCVLSPDKATSLMKAIRDQGAECIQAPQVIATELGHCIIRVGADVKYVRSISWDGGAKPAVAAPVVDRIWNGHDLNLVFATTSRDKISLSVRVQWQAVDLPMREFKALAPGEAAEVAIQVPRVVSTRGSACREVEDGSMLVVAARNSDGSWSLTVVTVQEIQPARMPLRRG